MKVQGTEKISPLEEPVRIGPGTPSQKRVALQTPVAVPPNKKLMEGFRGDGPESGIAATVTVRVSGAGVGVGVTQRFPTVQTEGRQHGVVPN